MEQFNFKIYLGGLLIAVVFGILMPTVNLFVSYAVIMIVGILIGLINLLGFIILIPYKTRISILEANDKLDKEFCIKTNKYLNNTELIFVLSSISTLVLYGILIANVIKFTFVVYILIAVMVYILIISALIFMRLIKFKYSNENLMYN